MSPTRASETVRCARRRHAADRSPTALLLRGGRLRPRLPRWTAHEFAEADYRWGRGTIRLRLVKVEYSRVVAHEGGAWREAEAVEIDSAGREGDRRQYLIRAERVPAPVARKRPRLRG
ncbi:MAG TPA: hypothetical protein VGB74_00295 [Actinoplanes sp.]